MKEHICEKINKAWKGTVTFENMLIESDEAKEIDAFLSGAEDITEELYQEKIARLREICPVTKKEVFYNKIVLSGRSIFAMRLNGELTYSGTINYGLVGTGTNVVTDGDTKLQTETKRKGIATRSRNDDSLSFRFYFSKSDVSGTLTEFGTVIDGTSTVDTGVLFNRLLTGGWIKSLSEALTVTVQFDLNPA